MAKNKNGNVIGALLNRLKAIFTGAGSGRSVHRVTTHLDLTGLSADDILRVCSRLARLYDLYRQRYRAGGNMLVPEPLSIEADGIKARLDHGVAAELSLDEASATLTFGEIDILLCTLLAQLNQLKSLNYLHGPLSPSDVLIHMRGSYWAIALQGLEKGRFLDDLLGPENESQTPWLSPEHWRWSYFSKYGVPTPADDMFAVGCFYHTLLTGSAPCSRSGMSAGEALARGVPVPVSGPDGPRAELMRWMMNPDPAGRPTPQQVMASLRALHDALPNLPPDQPPGNAPSKMHAPEQYIFALEDGRPALARRLPWFWEESAGEASAPLFERHAAFRTREINRLNAVSQRSRAWSDGQIGVSPCAVHHDVGGVSVSSPLPNGPLLTLGQVSLALDSPFLLDARMVDLLLAVYALHEDGWILGLISEDRFCVQATPAGGQVWLVDLSAAMPFNNLPAPGDIRPDAASDPLLSPELAQYIASTSEEARQAAEGWVSPASDIFSLGLMYHLILTGRLPTLICNGKGTYADAVCFSESPRQVIELDSRLDERHSELIYEMLTANPMERLADCGGVAWRILGFYTA